MPRKTKSWEERQRDIALQTARTYAKEGNCRWAQNWINRAGDFYPVSKTQLKNVQKLCDMFKKRRGKR